MKMLNNRKVGYSLIIALLVMFRSKFEILATQVFVNPLLKYCNSSWINDLIITAIAVILVAYYTKCFKSDYIASKGFTLFLAIITAIYSFYRIDGQVWTFTHLSIYNNLKYFDIIYIILLGNVSLVIKNLLSKKANQEVSPIALIIDEPINELKHDTLGRKELAEELARRIENTWSNKSFAVGITGTWGSGKTSFLNLLSSYFDKRKTILLEFNPWLNLNSESIVKEFFNCLRSGLEEYSAAVTSQLQNYSKKLIGTDKNIVANTIDKGLSLFNEKSIQEQFEEINDTLELLNKQVVILIDDLDRLERKEILSIIKLVRNTANFRNLKFIVAFDREYVLAAIKEINTHNYEKYLEKIFLQIVELPSVSPFIIKTGINEILSKRFPQKQEELNRLLWHRSPDDEIFKKEHGLSIRDVKRFLNQFVVDFERIQEEVLLDDFFIVEFIYYKYPRVYALLDLAKDRFVVHEDREANTGRYVLATNNTNIRATTIAIEDYLLDNKLPFNLSKEQIELIINLLNDLFDNSYHHMSGRNAHLSIIYPKNYHKYFEKRILGSDLSEKEFKYYLSKPETELKNQIAKWVNEGKKIDLVKRFEKVDIDDIEDKESFEKLIKCIFYLAKVRNTNSSSWEPSFFYSDFDLSNKFYDGYNSISKKFYKGNKESYEQFVKTLFVQAEYPYLFESEFVRNRIREAENNFILSEDQLTQLVLGYFSKYLNESDKVDMGIWDHFHNCISVKRSQDITGHSFTYEEKKLPEAKELLVDFIKQKDFDGFLLAMTQTELRNKNRIYLHNDLIESIFGSMDKFEDLLNQFSSKGSKYIEEFKNFYDQCKYNGFKSIEFEFSIMPVKTESSSD